MVVGRIVAVFRALVDVLGDHGHGADLENAHKGTDRVFQSKNNGMVIKGLDRFDCIHVGAVPRMSLAQEIIGTEYDIVGGERLAVVPSNPFFEMEGVFELVITDLPAGSQ